MPGAAFVFGNPKGAKDEEFLSAKKGSTKSTAAPKQAKTAKPKQSTHAKKPKPAKAPKQRGGSTAMAASDLLTYFPPLAAFMPQTMDVYSGNATIGAGSLRQSGVNILVTGTFLEGSRTRVQDTFSYTHIILCDPAIEIHDGYSGDTSGETLADQDQLAIPGGQTSNLWVVILSFLTTLPNLGRRKVILADRRAAGSWTSLV